MNQGVAERRIHTLWLNFKGLADKAAAAAAGICGTIWGLNIPDSPENPPFFWWFTSMTGTAWVWFSLTIFFAVLWGLALGLLQRPTYATLIRKHEKAEQSSNEKAEAIEGALRSVLRQLAKHCKAEGNGYRTSLYYHHDGEFVAVARVSSHPEHQRLEGGRKLHQSNQGVIGQAWGASEAYQSLLPEDRKEWETKVCSLFGYTPEQVSRFRMQSRSYGALRIEGHSGPVGVLVLESTNARGISRETIKSANGSLIRAALAEMVTAHAKLTPQIERLSQQESSLQSEGVSGHRPWKAAKKAQIPEVVTAQ